VNQEFDNELPKRKPKTPKAFIYSLWGISIAFLIIFISPLFMRSTCGGHTKSQSISNAKQIGLALFEFESDYGSYPNAETAKTVTDAFPNHGYDLSGNSSNSGFRQLIAAGIVDSEEMFYCKTKGAKKPDGDISPGHALEKGEVGFAYIASLSTSGNPNRPTVIGPVIPGTKKFDPKPFDGIAIVLKVDQSASAYKITEDVHIYDSEGLDILSATHPIWGGKAPDVRYPE
jgi:hypothetical protein